MTTPTDAPAAIERTIDLAAAPERVWSTLTDEVELAGWLGDAASFRPEPGAEGWLAWGDAERYAIRVESVEAMRSIAWRWARSAGTALDPADSTLVEFRLEPGPRGGTRLHLRESGFQRPGHRADNSFGWMEEFGDLLHQLATVPFEAGVRRVYHLASPVERVWAAFVDPAQLKAWWAGTDQIELRPGFRGWWDWEGMGRFGMAVDAVEPMGYLSWRWTPVTDVPVDEAEVQLRTMWGFRPRPDGGTDLALLESGFTEPEGYRMNSGGWDGDVVPGLRRVLGEAG